MSDNERLIGKMDAFIEFEGREHEEIRRRLAAIEFKLDELREWRWRLMGAAAVIAAIVAASMDLIGMLRG